MKILSFDTTNNLASVAIMAEGQILSYHATQESSQQAEKLFQLITQALEEASLKLEDIDLVTVTNGPGSFTGVRIGLAAALGMQMACRAKIIALSNFQVLAYQAIDKNKNIAVILDARREQVYLQSFNSKLESIDEAKLLSIEDISLAKDTILIGDGVKFIKAQDDLNKNVDAAMLVKASEFYLAHSRYSDIVPLYIREPDAIPKLNL